MTRPADNTSPARCNLYYLRRTRGWSQQHLADLVGVSRVYVHLVEGSKQAPSVRFSIACTTLFDIPAEVLFAALAEPNDSPEADPS